MLQRDGKPRVMVNEGFGMCTVFTDRNEDRYRE